MYRKANILFLMNQTPMHAGSGDSLGIVDMPIQRERHTGFPKIEASSLKGALREAFESLSIVDKENKKYKLQDGKFKDSENYFQTIQEVWKIKVKENGKEVEKEVKDKEENKKIKFDQAIHLTFGPENGDEHAGALGFTDARLLLFPVKSMKGVFVWITSPKVLKRFQQDMNLVTKQSENEKPKSEELKFDANINEGEFCFFYENNEKILISDKLILEEYTFSKSENTPNMSIEIPEDVLNLIEKDKIVILHDNDFTDFVNLSTEVITRNKINNETGTVAQGQLWTEEYLPAESVLYSMVMASDIFSNEKSIFKKGAEDVINFFDAGLQPAVQIGGNATLGKGITRTCFINTQKSKENDKQ